ncbi:MAG: hypothetical protein IT182_04025 [Acidobacteria bacterium]|nr:hypothetical protein [Acidobacteriota bacterium]
MDVPFPPHVLDALAGHGLRPTAETPALLLHDQVNDLYRFEIRRLRARLRAGEIPRASYAGEVLALRRRYVLLSLPLHRWRDAREGQGTPSSSTRID